MAEGERNMNTNYEYYRTFYYAAKYQSFTKAANILGSNQPNVTRTINRLEQELGCKLFLRSRQGAVLTPEGSRLFNHVEIAIGQLTAGEQELMEGTGLQGGSVALGASETALNLFLLEQLSLFHEKYPGIRLRISNHSTPQAIKALREGAVDLAVVTTPANAEKALHETKLASFHEILIGGRAFSRLAEKPFHYTQLSQYPLIMLGRDTMTYDFYNQLFLKRGLVLQADTEAATADQLLPLAIGNLGLAFVPEPLASQALERGEVYRIPLEGAPIQRHIILLSDHRRALSTAGREMERLLCSAAE